MKVSSKGQKPRKISEGHLPNKRVFERSQIPRIPDGVVIQLNAQRLADGRLQLDTIVPACSFTSMGSNTYTSYIAALSFLHS